MFSFVDMDNAGECIGDLSTSRGRGGGGGGGGGGFSVNFRRYARLGNKFVTLCTDCAKKATIQQATTMLATSKHVLLPGHNHLRTTSTIADGLITRHFEYRSSASKGDN